MDDIQIQIIFQNLLPLWEYNNKENVELWLDNNGLELVFKSLLHKNLHDLENIDSAFDKTLCLL